MKNRPHPFILTLFSLALHSIVCHAEEVALYDNTHFEAKAPPFVPADAPPPFYESTDTHGAFQFFTWESDNVSSVAVTLWRTGTPGGKIIFEVWDTGDDNLPGNIVGTLGRFAVDDLPEWGGPMSPIPAPVKVEGSVTGLESMTRYYLVLRNDDDVHVTGRNQTIHVAALFPGNHSWAGPGTPHPPEGAPLHEMLGQENYDGEWFTLTSEIGAPPGAWQHARITAACPEAPKPLQVDIETAVAISWKSQADTTYEIHSSTELENWTVVIEAIQGTGERLTHFFIRSETNIFYRVEESN